LKICQICGSALPEDHSFCMHCGKPYAAPIAQPQPIPAPAPTKSNQSGFVKALPFLLLGVGIIIWWSVYAFLGFIIGSAAVGVGIMQYRQRKDGLSKLAIAVTAVVSVLMLIIGIALDAM